MAILNITAEVVEHLLDLPEGVSVVGASWSTVGGKPVVALELEGGGMPEEGTVTATYSQSDDGVVSLIGLEPV